MRRRPVGVLLAWMALILSIPILGVLIYVVIGESRIGDRYLKRARVVRDHYTQWMQWLRARAAVDWSLVNPQAIPLQRQAESLIGLPALQGNCAELRNHRKLVVIDGEIAYTGSQNLVDPRCFKQNAGVGEWIDAMLRIEGPAVEAIGGTFMFDWEVVTGDGLEARRRRCHLRIFADRSNQLPFRSGRNPDS